MPRLRRDSETQTAEPQDPFSSALTSADLMTPAETLWIRSQLPLLHKILDQLDAGDLTPQQQVGALRNLRRPLLEMVKVLSHPDTWESDPKVLSLTPSPTSAQRLLERMCRNLDHLLLALDQRRYRASLTDQADRHWTIQQLFVFLGNQIELSVLGTQPCPPRTWQRLHDLFAYLIEREGLRPETGSADLGWSFDPETAYKRALLLGLLPGRRAVQRPYKKLKNQVTRWAIETRLAAPEGHLGEYGLIVVETSRDGPPRLRTQPVNDPWRGWVLEPPREFLDFLGIHRPALALTDPWVLSGARR